MASSHRPIYFGRIFRPLAFFPRLLLQRWTGYSFRLSFFPSSSSSRGEVNHRTSHSPRAPVWSFGPILIIRWNPSFKPLQETARLLPRQNSKKERFCLQTNIHITTKLLHRKRQKHQHLLKLIKGCNFSIIRAVGLHLLLHASILYLRCIDHVLSRMSDTYVVPCKCLLLVLFLGSVYDYQPHCPTKFCLH